MSKPNKKNIDIMTAFFQELEEISKIDKNVFFITADHGAWALANFKKSLKALRFLKKSLIHTHPLSM